MSLLDDVAEAVAMRSIDDGDIHGSWPTPLHYERARRAIEAVADWLEKENPKYANIDGEMYTSVDGMCAHMAASLLRRDVEPIATEQEQGQ